MALVMEAEQWRRVSVAFIKIFNHELRIEEDINFLNVDANAGRVLRPANDEERPVELQNSLDLQADALLVTRPADAFMLVCAPVVTNSNPAQTGTLFSAVAMGVATISPSWIQGRVRRLGLNELNSASIGLVAAGSGWSELQLSSMLLRPWFSHIVLFHIESQTFWDVPCSRPPRLLPVHLLERYANRARTPLFLWCEYSRVDFAMVWSSMCGQFRPVTMALDSVVAVRYQWFRTSASATRPDLWIA